MNITPEQIAELRRMLARADTLSRAASLNMCDPSGIIGSAAESLRQAAAAYLPALLDAAEERDRLAALCERRKGFETAFIALTAAMGKSLELPDGAKTETVVIEALLDKVQQNQSLTARVKELEAALVRLRDCDWVTTPADRMDAVRDIAREALKEQP